MCAIIDANVVGEVFGPNPTPAGKEFRAWIIKRSGRLICGGELLEELMGSSDGFRKWAREALNSGRMKNINKKEVETRTKKIRQESLHSSNDPHILALAQVSGARLLYSDDKKLREDFKNKKLLDPVGSIYSTLRGRNLTRRDLKKLQNLLNKKGLCPSAQ